MSSPSAENTETIAGGARSPGAPEQPLLLEDCFDDDRACGRLLGTRARSGHERLGVDREGALGADHGAARIRFLLDPGWGQASLAYGPFPARPGLTMAVHLTNGLNTSQTNELPETRRERLARLVRNLPRLVWNMPTVTDNLAVGWFAASVPAHPPTDAPCVVNGPGPVPLGELRVHAGEAASRVALGVPNLPVVLLVALREDSTAFYAASLPGAYGYGALPYARPIGVVVGPPPAPEVFAGIHQSVLGEVRYRVDTRIHSVRAATVDHLASWHGVAMLADRFRGDGPVTGSAPAVGPRWTGAGDGLHRTERGLVLAEGSDSGADAAVQLAEPFGLVHLTLTTGAPGASLSLGWTGVDGSIWRLVFDGGGARLDRSAGSAADRGPRGDGAAEASGPSSAGTVSADAAAALRDGATHTVQVLDDGATVAVHLDGRLVFDSWVEASPPRGPVELRLAASGTPGALVVTRLEVQPRSLPLPPALDPGPPWMPAGEAEVCVDRFTTGTGGADLAGREAERGGIWERSFGEGVMEWRSPGIAAVRASRTNPNPGRTVYSLPWADPDFADVSVTITPPGERRGDGNAGRAGIVFWEDAGNHLLVNDFIDDVPEGVSVSAFLRNGGHEHMFEWNATWSNVGHRIRRGHPHRMRLVFDGDRFVCFIDGEPVLARSVFDYRAVNRRLRIRRVGVAANWEWGDDTGSTLAEFVALGRRLRS